VKLKDSALVAAAVLSQRYIADRFLPDKAIDLVDEAAARLRMEIDSMPVELDEIERRVMQLEIEREALRKEKDKASRERLEKLDKELADLKENRGRLKTQWEQEKDAISRRASSRKSSKPCGSTSSGRSARATTPRRRSCNTAGCHSSKRRSRCARRTSPPALGC
jgi:ATP-dependent Clp protease ATP-binding subunit ClpB